MEKLVFFVDDDKMMLNLMEYTFNCREGFQVKSFMSGEDCIKNINLDPNLIVLDYYMGGHEDNSLSGLDTLKQIREAGKDTPVIILSREKSEDTISEFMKYGAQKYVVKDDYFIDTLIETIEKHFEELKK
ncbi:MAG: response regulator [Bacteroidales bacterium]|nr:response regulator [Bacteroidales bacterium]MBN2821233.1 response regulator [Bacteroidales bacterium]